MLSRFTKLLRKAPVGIVNFLKQEDGPTAVEYAVMLALIIAICLVAITALGTAANQTFANVGSAISGS
jgi:pilus assembly protein Flp/PilA